MRAVVFTLVILFSAVMVSGCGDAIMNRLDQVGAQSSAQTGGNFPFQEFMGGTGTCGNMDPNVLPFPDVALNGQDHYTACFGGGTTGISVWVEGESSFSDNVCLYPLEDNGGTDIYFLPDPNNGGQLLKSCGLASTDGTAFSFNLDASNQQHSFNSIVIVSETYQFAFEAWINGTSVIEPPYSYGELQ